jgi:antitoxin component of MazEF toxin-antitoxin module
MEALIRDIGNSKGIIIPKSLVEKYHLLKKVLLIETKDGLVIKPTLERSLFEEKLARLRANKDKIYNKMSKEASDTNTIAYYEQQADGFGDIDLEIVD